MIIWLSGPYGVGKSTLAEAMAAKIKNALFLMRAFTIYLFHHLSDLYSSGIFSSTKITLPEPVKCSQTIPPHS